MTARADRNARRPAKAPPPRPRFDIDRTWVLRIALALIVIAGLVLIGRMSSMVFDSGGKRLQRYERQAEPAPPHGETSPPRAGSPP